MALGLFHYQILADMVEKMHFIYDELELSNFVLENLSKALQTEAGTIFKLKDDKLIPVAAYGISLDVLKEFEFKRGQGVVGWVAQYSQGVKVDDAEKDSRFLGKVDAVTKFKTKSIIAAPIMAKGNVLGVIELLNKKSGNFNLPELELINIIGFELGTIFENINLINELKKTNDYLKILLNSLKAGLMVLDKDLNILLINKRAKEILKTEDDNRNLRDMNTNYLKFKNEIINCVSSSKSVSRAEINDSNIFIGYSLYPVNISGGISYIALFQDITEYRKTEVK